MTNGIGRVGWRTYVSPLPNPLWNGMLAYYTGDNTADDAKGTAHGTLTNGTTYGTGKINGGFSFDGINDTVTLSNTVTKFSSSTPFTYNVWVKAVSRTGFIYMDANASAAGTSIGFYGGALALTIGDVAQWFGTSVVIPLNTWTMVTITYNGTVNQSNNLLFYTNGTFAQGLKMDVSFSLPTASSNKQIGSGGWRGYFNGNIDELGIWNRELTSSEITELYNAGAGKQYVAPAPTYTTRTAALIAATGITDTTKINAINAFDLGIISNNLPFGADDALYLGFLGDSLKNKYNFINTTKYPLTFLGGWDFTNGMKGNGTNGYAKTGWIPSTLASSGSSYGVYSRQSVATNHSLLSSYTGAASGYFGPIGRSSNSIDFYNQSGSAGSTANSLPRVNRFIQSSKSYSSLTQNISVDTTQIALSMGSSSLSGREVYISTFNNLSNPTDGYYANEDLCCIYLSSQIFTTSQQLILNGLVNNMLTTLGLNV
jgi:hypothetical protein